VHIVDMVISYHPISVTFC